MELQFNKKFHSFNEKNSYRYISLFRLDPCITHENKSFYSLILINSFTFLCKVVRNQGVIEYFKIH